MMSVRRGNARRVDTAHHWSYGIVMDERARGLTTFAPGVWLATDPVRILGTHLGATMAVWALPEPSCCSGGDDSYRSEVGSVPTEACAYRAKAL